MWVKREELADNEIFNDIIGKRMSREYIEQKFHRNHETPYGFFVDLIKDYYHVTLAQADRLSHKLCQHYGFE